MIFRKRLVEQPTLILARAANQFGLVAITGAATLAGTLDVTFANGFTPTSGSSYKVMTFGSHTGTFTAINVHGLASGLTVTPQYNSNNVTLVIGGSPVAPLVLLAGEPSVNSSSTTDTQPVAPATTTNNAVKCDRQQRRRIREFGGRRSHRRQPNRPRPRLHPLRPRIKFSPIWRKNCLLAGIIHECLLADRNDPRLREVYRGREPGLKPR